MSQRKQLIILLLLGFSLMANAQKNTWLKLKLSKGLKLNYKLVSDQLIKFSGNDIPQKSTMFIQNEVIDIGPDGNYEMKWTFKRIIIDQINPTTGQLYYDSNVRNAPNNIFKQIFSPLVDAYVVYTLNPQGKVIAIKETTIKQNEQSLKNQVHSVFVQLPNNTLKVGETWSYDSFTDIGGNSLLSKHTYEVKSIQGKTLLASYTIIFYDKNGKEEKGKETGTKYFNMTKGFTTKGNANQTIEKFNPNVPDMQFDTNISFTQTEE